MVSHSCVCVVCVHAYVHMCACLLEGKGRCVQIHICTRIIIGGYSLGALTFKGEVKTFFDCDAYGLQFSGEAWWVPIISSFRDQTKTVPRAI